MIVNILLDLNEYERDNNAENGKYAVVEDNDIEIVLECDSIRSKPLFYQIENEMIYISDYAEKIQTETKAILLENNVNELLKTGYVTENETVYKDIFQVLPGQRLHISKKDGSIRTEQIFSLEYSCKSKKNEQQLIREFDDNLLVIFTDLIERLEGRTAVVPLSAGADSRTVVAMLKRLNYEKVICFSYGANNNYEAIRSKEIAESLGYQWLFVEYTPEKWEYFYSSDEYKRFIGYSTRGSGIGCIQAIIAITELKTKGLLPEDAVVIPGHALDFLMGSHLPLLGNDKIYNKRFVNELIFTKHYLLNSHVKSSISKWSNRVSDKMTAIDVINYIMKWEWINRQAKFIANDVRTYEFVGYDWELPFWDVRLCEFCMNLPYEYLYKRKLQYKYMEKIIDPYIGITEEYNYETQKKELKTSVIKRLAKRIFPRVVTFRCIAGCIKRYKGTSNAFYNHYSRTEYYKLIKKYGFRFNVNSIVADKYISTLRTR